MTEADLPDEASKIDFRDPKLWRDNEGIYWAAVGSRIADGSGQILLFRSEDAFSRKYFSTNVSKKRLREDSFRNLFLCRGLNKE